jgi:hypothetical protein
VRRLRRASEECGVLERGSVEEAPASLRQLGGLSSATTATASLNDKRRG